MSITQSSTILAVDCGRYSEERYSPECEEKAETGLGIVVVGSLVLLAIGYVLWRLLVVRLARRGAERS